MLSSDTCISLYQSFFLCQSFRRVAYAFSSDMYSFQVVCYVHRLRPCRYLRSASVRMAQVHCVCQFIRIYTSHGDQWRIIESNIIRCTRNVNLCFQYRWGQSLMCETYVWELKRFLPTFPLCKSTMQLPGVFQWLFLQLSNIFVGRCFRGSPQVGDYLPNLWRLLQFAWTYVFESDGTLHNG